MNESEVSKVTSEKPATPKKDVVVKTEKQSTKKHTGTLDRHP